MQIGKNKKLTIAISILFIVFDERFNDAYTHLLTHTRRLYKFQHTLTLT